MWQFTDLIIVREPTTCRLFTIKVEILQTQHVYNENKDRKDRQTDYRLHISTINVIADHHLTDSMNILTEPQLSKVATSDLLSNSKVWADHRHRLAGNAGALAGAVAGPLADTRHCRDLPHRLRRHMLRLPELLCTLSPLGRHCPAHRILLEPAPIAYWTRA